GPAPSKGATPPVLGRSLESGHKMLWLRIGGKLPPGKPDVKWRERRDGRAGCGEPRRPACSRRRAVLAPERRSPMASRHPRFSHWLSASLALLIGVALPGTGRAAMPPAV